MGEARRRWFLDRVIPEAFTSGKTCRIILGRRRTPGEGMDLDKRRPQAPGEEAGTVGP